MKIKKYLTFNNLILALGLAATVFILFWRFKVEMIRSFDEDEFVHMVRASFLTLGKIPYRDFGYFYSPVWISFLFPAFFFFKENIAAIFMARATNFLVFLALVFVTWLVGKEISGRRSGILAAFLVAFLPLAFAKTIEIRPDCLALVFFFLAFLFFLKMEKHSFKNEKLVFLAGACFGFSTVILLKTLFGYFGFLVYIFLSAKIFSKKFFRHLFLFHLGMTLPWLFLALVFLVLGILKEGFNSIIITPFLITKDYSWKYFSPFFPFRQNDLFYGIGGKSLPWFLNHFVLVLGIFGFLFSFPGRIFLVISFIAFVLPIFFLYKITNVQYYLPFLFILCLSSAQTLGRVMQEISRRSKPVFLFYWVAFFALCSCAFYQMAKIHYQWNNWRQIEEVQTIWTVSNPGDYFYDQAGRHLFRPSGFYFCCDFLDVFRESILLKYPSLIGDLKKTETKFLFKNPRLGRLSSADNRFLAENYFPSEVENIWVVGIKINLKKEKRVLFELFASGFYQLKNNVSLVFLDHQKVDQGSIYLQKGIHEAASPIDQELFLAYDIWANLLHD